MDTCHENPHASLAPEWRAQSPSSHGQLPADISDAIPRRGVQRPRQMLKLSVLVLKLNFIVTLSRCYCTGSASRGMDFITEDAYESLGLRHCTAPNYNSSLPSEPKGAGEAGGRRDRGERRGGRQIVLPNAFLKNTFEHAHICCKREIYTR